jgi:hypothetical protein
MKHAFCGDRDSLVVGQVADHEDLATVRVLDLGFGVQRAEPRWPQIAEADGSGRHDRVDDAIAGDVTQEVIQDQNAVAAVDVPGRPFVGGSEVGVEASLGRAVVLDVQRGSERVAWSNGDIPPRDGFAVRRDADAERARALVAAQLGGGGVDLGLGRREDVVADLGPEGGVDELAHRIGECLVGPSQQGNVLVRDLREVHMGRSLWAEADALATDRDQLPGQDRSTPDFSLFRLGSAGLAV